MTEIIHGPTIYTEQGPIAGHSIVVEDGIIQEITDKPLKATQTFPTNYHLIPGMIDMHIHGANGADVMDASPQALNTIIHALPAEGTTAFVPTTMTQHKDKITEALENIANNATTDGAEILGINLEGPFISRQKLGAQSGRWVLEPDTKLFDQWQQISGNKIKNVTIAPEEKGTLDLIKHLHNHGVIASLGHSNCSYEKAVAGIAAGASNATHLFNAMSNIHHRFPGLPTAVLLDDSVTVEIIADGIHLHPAIIQLIFKIKGPDKIILITDSIRAKFLDDGTYELGGQKIKVVDYTVTLEDGTLAGSTLTMDRALRNVMKFTGCSLTDAITMATKNPAEKLGVFNRKGSLAPNKDGDIVILDDKYQVVMTMCKGL